MQTPSSSATEVPLVSLRSVVKRYGARVALRIQSMDLHSHDMIRIVGGNGSGKSTLMRVLAGITRVSDGDYSPSRAYASLRLGYVPQNGGIYPGLTLQENVRLFSKLTDTPLLADLETQWYIQDLDLGQFLHTEVKKMSGGFQRLSAIACSLSTQPQGLFLDEPFTGIDAVHAAAIARGLNTKCNLNFLVVTDHSTVWNPARARIIELATGGPR